MISKTSPRAKAYAISNTSPRAQEYNPTTHDDGHEYLWNGEKEATALKNVALHGLKLVSDTAAHYIPEMFTTDT